MASKKTGVLLPKAAKDLLRRGFHVFPTRPGQKGFYKGIRWSTDATNDPVKVSEWAHNPDYRGCNWGVATGPSGLVVLDIDGPVGEGSLSELELIWGKLPETLICRTASGGRHLYFYGQAKSTVSVGWDGSKLDSRSVGGMVFAPGSTVGEGIYEWEIDDPIADCPEWLVDLIGEARKREREKSEPLSEDAEADIIRGQRWLDEQPPAIEGEGGDNATYRIMQMLRDFGLSVAACAELVHDSDWNQRCEPPWEYEELLKKAENAAAYSYGEQGSRSVAVDFQCDEDPGEEDGEILMDEEDEAVRMRLDPLLVEMNRIHSKQAQGRKVAVWCQEHGETGIHWALYPSAEFDKLYEHRRKEVGDGSGGSKGVPLGRWWREHPKHMRSKGVVLDPNRPSGPTGIDEPFNLWCGWGVKPRYGGGPGAKYYQQLIQDALCSGDAIYARYVYRWCALLVQQPTTLPKVALVFRGEKGTGKSTLGLALCDAFGAHGVKVDRLSAVTGQFNWHLKNKVFLLAEEIKWLQERGGEGVLKSMITDYHKGFEAKGIDMVEGLNYLSVMINSNSEWVVPVSTQDERRFAVFDVHSCLRTNAGFWDKIYAGNTGRLQREPLADFLGWLQKLDISGFDPIREVPRTQALVDQSIESLDFIERWWFDKIEQGLVPGIGEDWEGIHDWEVPTEDMYQDYCAGIPIRFLKPRHSLGRRLTQFGIKRRRASARTGGRGYVYIVPPRNVAKARFFSTVNPL